MKAQRDVEGSGGFVGEDALGTRRVVYNHWIGLVDWTGGLDWWTGLKIIFMLSNENSPVGLHLETQPLSFTCRL